MKKPKRTEEQRKKFDKKISDQVEQMTLKRAVEAEPVINAGRIIRTHANYKLGEYPGDTESGFGPGLTTPGMATSLEDLIDRFVVGREVPIQKDAVYQQEFDRRDMDYELAALDKMDKTERYLKAKEVADAIDQSFAKIREAQKKGRENELKRLRDIEASSKQSPPDPSSLKD